MKEEDYRAELQLRNPLTLADRKVERVREAGSCNTSVFVLVAVMVIGCGRGVPS